MLWALLCGSMLAQKPALAQDTLGTVVIVRVPRDAPVAARIRAELEANEWRVRELGPDASSARTALPSLASAHRARAALRMIPARDAVELWVASDKDAAGGGEVVRLPAGETNAALLALRATEALRARGLPLPRQTEAESVAPIPSSTTGGTPAAVSGEASSEAATRDSAAAERAAVEERARKHTEEAEARAEREQAEREAKEREAKKREAKEREAKEREAKERAERERLEREARAGAEAEAEEAEQAEEEEASAADVDEPSSHSSPALMFVEGGPAVAASPGPATLSASWAGWLNLRLQPASAWSTSGFSFLPFAGGNVTSNRGSGWMRSFMFGAAFDLHGAFGQLDLSAGAGAAMLLTLSGASPNANDPRFESQSDDPDFTSAVLARVGLHATVAPRIRIGARVVFGLALPKLRLVLAREEAAIWGQPFGVAVIAVDFGLPFFTR